MPNFEKELTTLLNRHSKEQSSNTPDFILATFLNSCLITFNVAVQRQKAWHSRTDQPTETYPNPNSKPASEVQNV